jgi:methylated-DNA-[protein]-cysteine S-methyltransferase
MKFPTLDMEAHNGKEFMCKVWNVLKDRVGPGQTVSYGELAKLCGNPKAARAVGQAMRSNPFTIVVPCHRVINASGGMGNYSSGVDKKQWLLKHEGRDFSTST